MEPVASVTLHINSTCRTVMMSSSRSNRRKGTNSESTIAKPENTAPATKYGGKMVVCQPGITEVAKSKDTMVCTESTSGVERPASTSQSASARCQFLAVPVQPNEAIP